MNPGDEEPMSTTKAMKVLQDVSQRFGKFDISQKEIMGMTAKEVKRMGMNMEDVRQAAAVLNKTVYDPPPEPLPLSKPTPARARVPPLPELPIPPRPEQRDKPPLKMVNVYKYRQKDDREVQARRRLQEKSVTKKKTKKFDPEQPSTSRQDASDEEKEEDRRRQEEQLQQSAPAFKTKRYYVF